MELTLDRESFVVYKALASETRLQILNLIADKPLTVTELAGLTGFSKAIISRHMQILETARLIRLHPECSPDSDGRRRAFSLNVDRIEIEFPKKIYLPYSKKTTEIKLGYFSDFMVQPTCGLAGSDALIGSVDDPRAFVANDRILASLLWFADGYVEYIIPNELETGHVPELLEISLELASEFPASNNNWPSDITFAVNDVEVGTWTSPGNCSDVRGKYTPDWWSSSHSQYGYLKHLRISNRDSGIDGQKFSDVTLHDLKLMDSPFIKFRVGLREDAVNKGGLTIFGEQFGNHPQNILVTLYYSERE